MPDGSHASSQTNVSELGVARVKVSPPDGIAYQSQQTKPAPRERIVVTPTEARVYIKK